MKKRNIALSGAALIVLFLFTTCIREIIYPEDRYTPFPEAEILGARFYYQRNNQDVTGDEAGMISKNDDGTYKVRMRRRVPSNVPTAMFLTGSFTFSDYYKITCTFPDDPKITDKPYRVYACASVGLDGNTVADYPTATDLKGQAVFRNGVAIGTFDLTNEGVNTINPDKYGRPHITVFLYLYFNNVSNPDDYYEFQLDFAGGAHGVPPASPATKVAIYRQGDPENKFFLEEIEETKNDPVFGPKTIYSPVLAKFDHRFDSQKLNPAVTTVNTEGLCIDLQFDDGDVVGKEIEFEILNVGLLSTDETPAPEGSNLLTEEIILGATVLAGTGAGQDEQKGAGLITQATVTNSQHQYRNKDTVYYKVKAKVVEYADGPGIKLVILGDETFTGTKRFTMTINLPETFVGN